MTPVAPGKGAAPDPAPSDRELIGSFYAAITALGAWPVVLQALAEAVSAAEAVITVHAPASDQVIRSARSRRKSADGGGVNGFADARPPFHASHGQADFRIILGREAADRAPGDASGSPSQDGWTIATTIRDGPDDAFTVSLRGFTSLQAAEAALRRLNGLHADIARALTVSMAMQRANDQATVDGLNAVGAAAAIVDHGGHLRASNASFKERIRRHSEMTSTGFVLTDPLAQRTLADMLAGPSPSAPRPRFVPIFSTEDERPAVLHLLPLPGGAPTAVEMSGVLLVIGGIGGGSVPSGDMLRRMFDLSPAEAELARALASGMSVREAAHARRVSVETARTQLKAIFNKLGISRQAELIALLRSISLPI